MENTKYKKGIKKTPVSEVSIQQGLLLLKSTI